MIEVRQARYFLAVAETLHFGRAAEQLAMSQPPLSQAILQLERQLGVTLFDRSGRKVTLTETGRVFAAECRKLVAAAQHAQEVATQAEAGLVGTLRIGVVTSALSEPLLEHPRRLPARPPPRRPADHRGGHAPRASKPCSGTRSTSPSYGPAPRSGACASSPGATTSSWSHSRPATPSRPTTQAPSTWPASPASHGYGCAAKRHRTTTTSSWPPAAGPDSAPTSATSPTRSSPSWPWRPPASASPSYRT